MSQIGVGADRHATVAPEGTAARPIRQNGTEGCWRLRQATVRKVLEAGCIRPGTVKGETTPIYYLAEGERAKIEAGVYTVIGRRSDGSVETSTLALAERNTVPHQWRIGVARRNSVWDPTVAHPSCRTASSHSPSPCMPLKMHSGSSSRTSLMPYLTSSPAPHHSACPHAAEQAGWWSSSVYLGDEQRGQRRGAEEPFAGRVCARVTPSGRRWAFATTSPSPVPPQSRARRLKAIRSRVTTSSQMSSP